MKHVRARREALLLGIAHDAACDAWRKVTADRMKIARARRGALILAIVQDAAREAWSNVLADRLKIARARRVAVILGIVQDAALDASTKVASNRSSATATPIAPRLRVVRVEDWRLHTSSTGAKYVYGRLYGHASIDEGAYGYVPLPSSADATTSEMVNVPKLTTSCPYYATSCLF